MSNNNDSLQNGHLAECPGTAVYYLSKVPQGAIFINYMFIVTVNVMLSILGATANLLVMLAYFIKLRRLRRIEFNTTLLAFLAAADFLTTAVAQPLVISRHIMELFDLHFCMFWLIIRRIYEFTVPVSFLTVGLITYERYQALFHPIKYRSHTQKRRIKRAMVGAWVFALVTTALRTFRFFAIIYYILSFLIITALVVANTIIYLKIGRMARHFSKNRADRIRSSIVDGKDIQKTLSRDKRSTRTLFYIFLSLFLCYLPTAGAILYSLIKGTRTIGFLFGYLPWADTFAFLNSTLDPFIYCFRNPRLKDAVLGLICKNRKPSQNNEIKNSLMLHESGSANRGKDENKA